MWIYCKWHLSCFQATDLFPAGHQAGQTSLLDPKAVIPTDHALPHTFLMKHINRSLINRGQLTKGRGKKKHFLSVGITESKLEGQAVLLFKKLNFMPIQIYVYPWRADTCRLINCYSCVCVEIMCFVLGNLSSVCWGVSSCAHWPHQRHDQRGPRAGLQPRCWDSSAPVTDTRFLGRSEVWTPGS